MKSSDELRKLASDLERLSYFPGEELKGQFSFPSEVTYTFDDEKTVDEAVEILSDYFWGPQVDLSKEGTKLTVKCKPEMDDSVKVELDYTMHNLFGAEGAISPR